MTDQDILPPQACIATARLHLRPLAEADALRVRALAGEYEVAAGTTNIPHPYAAGMAERWIAIHRGHYARGELATWAAALADDNAALIGAVTLHFDTPHNRAELSYWLGVPYWGQGYGVEAAGAVTHYGFEQRGLQKVTASILADNLRSARLLDKLGFTCEGRQRRQICKWDTYHDLLRYGILREEYAAQVESGLTYYCSVTIDQ